MATYAIGDIQGCFDTLHDLLEVMAFDPNKDTLWLTGDLVNRGPDSLAVLRWARSLPHAVVVLGNHDLHLIALAHGYFPRTQPQTLDAVMAAPDAQDLVDWLCHRPLMHVDTRLGYSMVHAGIYPGWSIPQAMTYAQAIADLLSGKQRAAFLQNMYGNTPTQWDPKLSGWARYRFFTNTLTRMRFCYDDLTLDLEETGPIDTARPGLFPWFQLGKRQTQSPQSRIIFGHWAALDGTTNHPCIHNLDGGCVWGRRLMGMRLEDRQIYTVPACKQDVAPAI